MRRRWTVPDPPPFEARKPGTPGGDGRKALGARGEDAAVKFLSAHGLRVLERNYRCRFGELDIVALDGETVVFVEVKLRFHPFDPFDAVDERKQGQISRAAFDFLERRAMLDRPARFDVIAVEGRTHLCDHVVDAFESVLD